MIKRLKIIINDYIRLMFVQIIYRLFVFLKRSHYLFRLLVCSVGYWEQHVIKLANNRVMVNESNGV